MSVSTIEGKTGTAYKAEDFFAAIAVLGDELDYVRFVGHMLNPSAKFALSRGVL